MTLPWVATLVLAVFLVQPLPAAAIEYTFTKIADTGGAFSSFGITAPSINNNGSVAFWASLVAGGSGLFVEAGGVLTTIVDTSTVLPGTSAQFTQFDTRPAINDDATVAFAGALDNGDAGIFVSDSGLVSTVTRRAATLSNFGNPDINNSGTVSFAGNPFLFGDSGIFSVRGVVLTTIADTSGPFSGFFFDNGASINDNGVVAFGASLDVGGFAVATGNGGAITTIADTTESFNQVFLGSINDTGTVALSTVDNAFTFGIFTGDGGPLTSIVDSTGPFSNFGFVPNINDNGDVAFAASLDAGGSGIFTGPSPVADKVILTGDSLFGSTVTSLSFLQGLNNFGQVAFRVTLADGREVIVRADPVGGHTFTKIADSSSNFSAFRSDPAINDSGTVVFKGFLDAGGEGIFAGNGGAFTTIADTSGPIAQFGERATINGAGRVAFRSFLDVSGQQIFTGTGGPLTPIADTSTDPFVAFGDGPAITNGGKVAFRGFLDAGGQGIFTGTSAGFISIVDSTGPIFAPAAPSITDTETVAFHSVLDDSTQAIITSSDGLLTTIVDTSGPFHIIGSPSINDAEVVVFRGVVGASDEGIFIANGGPPSAVADINDLFASFGLHPSINDDGTVVFEAALDAGGEGIFTGPDPVADKVIQTGDPLLGSIVTSVALSSHSLNNKNQIAFWVALANGIDAIVRADPIPPVTFETMVSYSVTLFFEDDWLPFVDDNDLLLNYPPQPDPDCTQLAGFVPLVEGAGARFRPHGVTLDEAATAGGFHHFNWLQYFDNNWDGTVNQDTARFECTDPGVECQIDPKPLSGGSPVLACYYGRPDEVDKNGNLIMPIRDMLPWYLDEQFTNDGQQVFDDDGNRIAVDDTKLEAWTVDENTLLFSDAPTKETRFKTCLVGTPLLPPGTPIVGEEQFIVDAKEPCFWWYVLKNEPPAPTAQGIDIPAVFEDFGLGIDPEGVGVIGFGGFFDSTDFTAGELKLFADFGIGVRGSKVVTIDITPRRDPNVINIRSSGKIPVAILSTSSFDAFFYVDQASLTFGRAGDEPSLAFCAHNPTDMDRDGLPDLLCRFNIRDTGFQPGDHGGILRGETMDGVPLVGGDAVTITGE